MWLLVFLELGVLVIGIFMAPYATANFGPSGEFYVYLALAAMSWAKVGRVTPTHATPIPMRALPSATPLQPASATHVLQVAELPLLGNAE